MSSGVAVRSFDEFLAGRHTSLTRNPVLAASKASASAYLPRSAPLSATFSATPSGSTSTSETAEVFDVSPSAAAFALSSAAAHAAAASPAAQALPAADAFFARALRDLHKTPMSAAVSLLPIVFGVGSLVFNEFSDIATALTAPVPLCGAAAVGATICNEGDDKYCVAPSNGAFRARLNCSACIAQVQALVDAGGFSRVDCFGPAIDSGAKCSTEQVRKPNPTHPRHLPTSNSRQSSWLILFRPCLPLQPRWATFFPETLALRQTGHTISFTICLFVLIGIVALVLIGVELYFQRRSALAFAVIPFHNVLRKDVLLQVLLRKRKESAEDAMVIRRSRRHACCCGRDARVDCSGCCGPVCASCDCCSSPSVPAAVRSACAPICAIRDVSLHVSALFISVVVLAVVIYYSWKTASIDSMLFQLSNAPVVASTGGRLWAFSVSCGSAPVMLLIDIDSQRRAAVSAPQQAGIVSRIPSVVFALLLIASFLAPKVQLMVARDADPMKEASITTIVSRPGPGGGGDKGESSGATRPSSSGGFAGNFEEVTEGELDEALFDLLPRDGGCCRQRLRLFSWPLVPRSEEESQRLVALLLLHVRWNRRKDDAEAAKAAAGAALSTP